MWETMYGAYALGESYVRTLYCGDKRGTQTLYGYYVRGRSEVAATVDHYESGIRIPDPPVVVVAPNTN
jgi:hypothetical protein